MAEHGDVQETLKQAIELVLTVLDETEGEPSQAERAAIIGAVMPAVLQALGSPLSTGRVPEEQPLGIESPRGLVVAMGADTFSSQALCLAWYSLHEMGNETFTFVDVESMFKEARLRLPSNMSDVLVKLEDQGLLAGRGKAKDRRKRYVISAQGDVRVGEWLKGGSAEEGEPQA